MFIFFSSIMLVAAFGVGVYFADVVRRYLKKGLNLLIREIDNTPKKGHSYKIIADVDLDDVESLDVDENHTVTKFNFKK